MKTNRLLFFAVLICAFTTKAQLILTKAANEAVAGDVEMRQNCDSTTALPNNTGQNQNWNYSSIVQTTDAVISQTYVAASSIPSSSLFSGATLAKIYPSISYFEFFKSGVNQFEDLGYYDYGTVMNYTNSQVTFVWPVTYGYSQTDTYSAHDSGASTDIETGSQNVSGSGTGTLTMPGGQVFTNVLQLKLTSTEVEIDNTNTPATGIYTSFAYYHSSQKFPLLTIDYSTIIYDADTATFIRISINKAPSIVGLKNEMKENLFTIFPNPANDNITFNLSNPDNQNCSVYISNAVGQELKAIDLGSASNIQEQIDVSSFAPGIYFIKTNLGKTTEVKKVVIE